MSKKIRYIGKKSAAMLITLTLLLGIIQPITYAALAYDSPVVSSFNLDTGTVNHTIRNGAVLPYSAEFSGLTIGQDYTVEMGINGDTRFVETFNATATTYEIDSGTFDTSLFNLIEERTYSPGILIYRVGSMSELGSKSESDFIVNPSLTKLNVNVNGFSNRSYNATSASWPTVSGPAYMAEANVTCINSSGSNVTQGNLINADTYSFTVAIPQNNYYNAAELTDDSYKTEISQAGVSVSNLSAKNKDYDGKTTAEIETGSATISGTAGSETLTIASATGLFADADVGSGKSVTISDVTLGNGANGGLAKNYKIDSC